MRAVGSTYHGVEIGRQWSSSSLGQRRARMHLSSNYFFKKIKSGSVLTYSPESVVIRYHTTLEFEKIIRHLFFSRGEN